MITRVLFDLLELTCLATFAFVVFILATGV